MQRGLEVTPVSFEAGLSKMTSNDLSGSSVPTLKMLTALDPANLTLQFEALTGSALPVNQQSSEYRIPEHRPCWGLRVWVSISLFLEWLFNKSLEDLHQ